MSKSTFTLKAFLEDSTLLRKENIHKKSLNVEQNTNKDLLYKRRALDLLVNPYRVGLLNIAWLRGGSWISLHLLDHPKKFLFDFLKIHNELGKVTKFGTSRPLFSWRNSHLKKGPPCPIRVNTCHQSWLGLIYLSLLHSPKSRHKLCLRDMQLDWNAKLKRPQLMVVRLRSHCHSTT